MKKAAIIIATTFFLGACGLQIIDGLNEGVVYKVDPIEHSITFGNPVKYNHDEHLWDTSARTFWLCPKLWAKFPIGSTFDLKAYFAGKYGNC